MMPARPRSAWGVALVLVQGTFVLGSAVYLHQSFLESPTIRDHVNPHGRLSAMVDTHTVLLDIPVGRGISDENVLAQAAKGFFNGWVFYPEAKALQMYKPADKQYSKLASTTVPAHIWDAGDLSDSFLPALHTVLFGTFRLVDIQLADSPRRGGESGGVAQSHADFVFGSDMETFAGCHRLSVERREIDERGGMQKVQVSLECIACNPQSDAPVGGRALLAFHRLYASLLLKETAGQINNWLHPKEGVDKTFTRKYA